MRALDSLSGHIVYGSKDVSAVCVLLNGQRPLELCSSIAYFNSTQTLYNTWLEMLRCKSYLACITQSSFTGSALTGSKVACPQGR